MSFHQLVSLAFISCVSIQLGSADHCPEDYCPPNLVWMECGTCEGSCQNPYPICTMECKPEGCYCPHRDGYVRTGRSGPCIHKSECPTPIPTTPVTGTTRACPPNMVWKDCGTCEGTCEDPHPICTEECKPRNCYCPASDGYVRLGSDGDGPCVHESECPPSNTTTHVPTTTPQCGENEHWTECGGCDVFCELQGRPCTLQCRRKCECHKGMVRDWDGKCIDEKDCKPHPECAERDCPPGHKCVWSPKQCFTTPCPQTECVPRGRGRK